MINRILLSNRCFDVVNEDKLKMNKNLYQIHFISSDNGIIYI